MFPCNAAAVALWPLVCGQWRRAGMLGSPVALDYAAVESVFRMRRIPRRQWAGLLDQLAVMERATLDVLNKK